MASTDIAPSENPDDSGAVHFGDFKAAEYKFAFLFGNDGTSTPIAATPDNDIPDEPSSILASRVLSAHGNPSPPPTPSLKEPSEGGILTTLLGSWTPPNLFSPPRVPTLLPQHVTTQKLFDTVSDASEQADIATSEQDVFSTPTQPPRPSVSIPTSDIPSSPHSVIMRSPTSGEQLELDDPPPLLAEEVPSSDESMKEPEQLSVSEECLPAAPSEQTETTVDAPGASPTTPTMPSKVLSDSAEVQRQPRELRSLSPISSDLLMRLLPGGERLESPEQLSLSVFPPTPPAQPTVAEQSQPQMSLRTQSPIRSQPPVRFTTPVRHNNASALLNNAARFPSPPRTTGPLRFLPPGSALRAPPSSQLSPSRPLQRDGSPRKLPALQPFGTPRMASGNNAPVASTSQIHPFSSPLKRPALTVSQRKLLPNSTFDRERSRSTEPPPQPQQPKTSDMKSSTSGSSSKALPFSFTSPDKANIQPSTPSAKPSTTLKHPTSKIPRIGLKPYSRPTTSTASKVIQSTRNQKTPLVIRRVEVPSNPSNDSAASEATATDKQHIPATTSLKRKREATDTGALPAVKSGSTILGRTTFNNGMPASPLKKSVPFVIKTVHEPPTEPAVVGLSNVFPSSPPGSPDMDYFPISEVTSPPPTSPSPPASEDETIPSTSTSIPVRRTTRIRKPVMHVDPKSKTTTPKPRRKPPTPRTARTASSLDPAPFSGMSAVQLKALTTSNTVKNQHYLCAKLETEVIRKEGIRPDSPTSKVMISLQQRKEEADIQRKERAQRRARRSGEAVDADADESSACNDGNLWKHQRGPGDEEDFETPERPARPLKKLKSDEGMEENVMSEIEERRVRWNRGLFTTIYVDEVIPKGQVHPNDAFDKKGCLAEKAKSLRLDTLGNLADVDAPLTDLVPQNIVVKKFVYDDDIPPIVVPVAKATRSKSKKKS